MNPVKKTMTEDPSDLLRQTDNEPAGDPIVIRLRALAQTWPDLREAALHYETILPLLRDADLRPVPVSLSADQAREKLRQGLPLLHGLELDLDAAALRGLILTLSAATDLCRDADLPAALPATMAPKDILPEIGRCMSHLPAEEKEGDDAETPFPPDQLEVLARNALRPALQAWRRQLAPLAEGAGWERPCCFICGETATLAEFQGNNQERHLRCSQCGADWKIRRLVCSCCGNEDHRTLGYIQTSDPGDLSRIEVCNVCNGYIKSVTTFSPTPAEMLPVEDLATLHLDYLAQELGYTRQGR